jgi:wyosine [tRNA(Phe)-imidazoG37] synthetase (radical SAM superfamily)
MATFLFDQIIFGPVPSRRLGASLGINLLPNDSKICTFNCIYCECGWTESHRSPSSFHPREKVRENLKDRLKEMKENHEQLDTITFAGNGEPTMHPNFDLVIQDTIAIRNKYFPDAKIAVLSNASLIHKSKVYNALKRIDQNILKIDSAFKSTVKLINQPYEGFDFQRMVKSLIKFNGRLIIQTMFVRGEYKGQHFDNTTKEELDAWLELLDKINPQQVMIYTIARDTPSEGVEKISEAELKQIAQKVEDRGFKTQISS